MNMNCDEALTHEIYECKVRLRFEKPQTWLFLFNHLIIDNDIDCFSNSITNHISNVSQAESFLNQWFNSGCWIKSFYSDVIKEELYPFIHDVSAYGGLIIDKIEKNRCIFLQNSHDYQEKGNYRWIQVNARLKVHVQSRTISRREIVLVALESREKNKSGCYIVTDKMKEQALFMVRDYYQRIIDKKNLDMDIELSTNRKMIEFVICADMFI